MKLVCYWPTRVGKAMILLNPRSGRFHVFLGDEDLGNYISPQHAADDISGGYTFSHSSGVDTATLGIPEDVSEWECPTPARK